MLSSRFIAPAALVFCALMPVGAAAEELAREDVNETREMAESSEQSPEAKNIAPDQTSDQTPDQTPDQAGPDADRRAGGPPDGFGDRGPGFKPVFDENWATLGVGMGLVPSYSGSDDVRSFPLPLIVGRVAGIGISPNGPGLKLNLLSDSPTKGAPFSLASASVSFGPSFRLRSDRTGDVKDDTVALAEPLDTAFEVGPSVGLNFTGLLNRRDRLGVSAEVRWDILGAHEGMLIEPGVSYFTPVGRGASLQLGASATFVDDDYAQYYYSVTPRQSADTGLPQFAAQGGLTSIGLLAIATYDLDGNALNGGFNIYGVGGYSQLQGDGAATPYTSIRGSADQFILGIGLAYTF